MSGAFGKDAHEQEPLGALRESRWHGAPRRSCRELGVPHRCGAFL
eukprot:CAMPEP_0175327164 /NCGR_PEP_ID=MMETSP0093-20121207/74900_1 /TAXON_ID=311494 /ORGANISM="Alexandrium monilatum, Strain CCMP3105" /LENGTH=44 /DNA_ID= /DNA_START= /DNA_END= /DNA_ORIENTATION=